MSESNNKRLHYRHRVRVYHRDRGSTEAKQQQQQQQQQKKASSLLLESFLPVAANYEAVLNGGLLPIVYSARPLPRRFVRGAAKTAAVFEAARKKSKLDNDDTTTTTIQPSETKKEKNEVCGENVKNYLDALCTQLAEQMNGLEKTVPDDFVTKYVKAKMRAEGTSSSSSALLSSSLLFSLADAAFEFFHFVCVMCHPPSFSSS